MNSAFAEQNNASWTGKHHLQSSFDHACAILLQYVGIQASLVSLLLFLYLGGRILLALK